MIRSFSVAGFKSLEQFNLTLQPGLNVLVGPNGSGKTNIIRFLEFLSFLSDGSLVEAVSRSGGAGDIFSKNLDGSLKPQINFQISGSVEIDAADSKELRSIDYEYIADIELSIIKGTLEFKQQELTIYDFSGSNEFSFDDRKSALRTLLKASYFARSTGNSSLSNISIRDEKLLQSYYSSNNEQSLSDVIGEYLKDHAAVSDTILTSFLSSFIRIASHINRDLDVGQPLNINPSEVKKTEDIASRAGIASSGRGFAATLYFSKKYNISETDRKMYFGPDILTVEDLGLLVDYCKLVNDNIIDIRSEVDTLQNVIKTTVSFITDRGPLELSLSSVSDGTAKWLALVASILTRKSIFLIEEPENFLHPQMQREVIDIIRARNARSKRSFILSSHSETLINSLRPSELILVSFDEGRTIAKRVSNAQDIIREINRTGFGLSYYYLSGALS